jgi:hypothetical protein
MPLQAYVDASGKGDPHLLVIAGYIASADAWELFAAEWQKRLNEAHLPYFKMNEMFAASRDRRMFLSRH